MLCSCRNQTKLSLNSLLGNTSNVSSLNYLHSGLFKIKLNGSICPESSKQFNIKALILIVSNLLNKNICLHSSYNKFLLCNLLVNDISTSTFIYISPHSVLCPFYLSLILLFPMGTIWIHTFTP